MIPDYAGRCITNIVPAIVGRTALLPEPARSASQIVLLVLDGVGWTQMQARRDIAPMLSSMDGGPITSVAPTTTSTALSSIVSGAPPAEHGVVGYRVRVADDRVLNILRWRTADGDARQTVLPHEFQTLPAFPGATRPVPVVTKAEFGRTGFTAAMGIQRMVGWHAASSIAVEVGALLRDGEPLVYAYYDGVDRIAHAHGFGDHYDAELATADRLVADVAAHLPRGAALVVTSDHGQVDVGDATVALADDVLDDVALLSGEGRFVWLHAKPGRADALLERCRQRYGDSADVCTREEVVAAGWFGGPLSPHVAARLGDVALVATTTVAFLDPTDTGSHALRCRHGALTEDELLVPLVACPSPSAPRVPPTRPEFLPLHPPLVPPTPPAPRLARLMSDNTDAPRPAEAHDVLSPEPIDEHAEAPLPAPSEAVQQPAKVMRIGAMIRQLLEEVRRAPLDDEGRARLSEVYATSIQELSAAVSPDLQEELGRLVEPFVDGEGVPTEAELRIAQAQLVGWLEGLFHGIQATLFAQQLEARQQLEELRQRGLPPGSDGTPARPGTYL